MTEGHDAKPSLIVNGERREIADARQLAELLIGLGYQGTHFAVALNGEFVPRAAYANTSVKDGDSVEILKPLQGG